MGESDEDRDKILLQLDQECLDVYKRKVDMASQSRDLLIQALDDSKIELARLLSALGEKTIVRTVSKMTAVPFLNGYFFWIGFIHIRCHAI